MKLVLEAKGRRSETELRADGSIVGPRGTAIAWVKGNEIVGEKGKTLASVTPDGSVLLADEQELLRFSPKDELIGSAGTLRVNEDGTIIAVKVDGTSRRLPGHLEGFTAKGRRAGLLLIAIMVAIHRQIRSESGQSDATAAP
jgi:hypothetical protein